MKCNAREAQATEPDFAMPSPCCVPLATRISVVDDEAAVRESLRIVLERAGIQVDSFSSAEEFLSSDYANCDCLITDYHMPGLSGLELQEELARRKAHFPIVVMSGCADVPLAISAMMAGAVDILEKPFENEQLLKSLARAWNWGVTRKRALQGLKRAHELLGLLTPRETDVIAKLVCGLSNKETAIVLRVSPRTVEIHRASIMDKLAVRNLADMREFI